MLTTVRRQPLYFTDECLFCGKKKTWRSHLICQDLVIRALPLFVVTVCPDCRKKHTIEEMYEKAIEKLAEKRLGDDKTNG